MSIIRELKRRNVFKVALFYIVSSWFILQVADLLFDLLALPPTWLRLVLALLALGFPIALIVAWVYELTPEGLKRESEVDRSRSITPETGRRLSLASMAMLVIVAGLLLADRFVLDRAPDAPVSVDTGLAGEDAMPTVAVLPFTASGSDDGGFLAGGLHEDLLTRLAKLNAFRVISRTSMMEYVDTTKNIREIGAELGAGYILEGAVQARGERVRINAQLIDTASDEHLWADTYDRKLTAADLFDIQAELALAIADELKITLSAPDRALIDQVPTKNTEAYNAFLRGLEMRDAGGHNVKNIVEVIAAFEQAVDLDPEFALAWAHLSIERSRYSQHIGDDETRNAALAARDRAYALQPDLPEIHLADAVYLYRALYQYDKALRALEALEAESTLNGSELMLKAFLLRRLGRFEDAYRIALAAQALDPRSVAVADNLVALAWEAGHCDAAGRHTRAALALAPDAPQIRADAAMYEIQCTGDVQRASQLMDFGEYTSSWQLTVAAIAAETARDYERLLELSHIPGLSSYPQWHLITRATALRGLGRHDAANEVLDTVDAALGEGEDDMSEDFALAKLNYHAMRGDAEATDYWVREHRRRFAAVYKGDRYVERINHIVYAENLALAGLHDKALEELRSMLESPGGPRFRSVDSWPAFDGLKSHPGYIAIRERFAEVD